MPLSLGHEASRNIRSAEGLSDAQKGNYEVAAAVLYLKRRAIREQETVSKSVVRWPATAVHDAFRRELWPSTSATSLLARLLDFSAHCGCQVAMTGILTLSDSRLLAPPDPGTWLSRREASDG